MRVVSWNVHAMIGADGRHDPERIARVVEELRPDVARAAGGRARRRCRPASRIRRRSSARSPGLQSAFGRTMPHRPRAPRVRTATQSSPATRSWRSATTTSPCPGASPAAASAPTSSSAARWSTSSPPTSGLHWRERRRQAAQLLSADILRDAALAHPLVLVGDFNSLSNRSAVPRWLRRQLVDAALARAERGPHVPVVLPAAAARPLLRRRGVPGAAVEVHRSPLARRASDHLPLVVELELVEDARRPPAARPLEAAGVSTVVRTAASPGRVIVTARRDAHRVRRPGRRAGGPRMAMSWKAMQKAIDRDVVLERLGLERRTPTGDFFTGLGLFSVGVLVGAGLGIMFAPKRGEEMRSTLNEAWSNRGARGAGLPARHRDRGRRAPDDGGH